MIMAANQVHNLEDSPRLISPRWNISRKIFTQINHKVTQYIMQQYIKHLYKICLSVCLSQDTEKTSSFCIDWLSFFNTLGQEQNGWHLQMTFSNVFSCVKIVVYWFIFQWNLFLNVQLTKHLVQIMGRHWTGDKPNDGLVYWQTYPSLCLNGLW